MDRPRDDLDVHPLTPERWDDLVALFTGRGIGQVRWCWCMYYRRSGRGEVPAATALPAATSRAIVPASPRAAAANRPVYAARSFADGATCAAVGSEHEKDEGDGQAAHGESPVTSKAAHSTG